MRQDARNVCSIVMVATAFVFCAAAHAQQEFNRDQAAKAIADSEMFKDCHNGLNNWDACNWPIYTGRWNSIADRWGSSADHLQPEVLKTNPVGYWLYKEKGYLQLSFSPETLSLSEKGRTASKDWIEMTSRDRGANGTPSTFERWDVPLAKKEFVAITDVVQGWRMGSRVAEVHYLWSYSLTALGAELFKNQRIPASNRGNAGGWIAPAELTGINLSETYQSKAAFILQNGGWHLQEDCRGDLC